MKKEIEILENAYTYYQASNQAFDTMKEFEEENDSEMAHTMWAIVCEETGKARGLLEAYEIMTGKSLYEWEIRDELERIADVNCIA